MGGFKQKKEAGGLLFCLAEKFQVDHFLFSQEAIFSTRDIFFVKSGIQDAVQRDYLVTQMGKYSPNDSVPAHMNLQAENGSVQGQHLHIIYFYWPILQG